MVNGLLEVIKGIGSFQGLISRASNSNKINEIHLEGEFKFEKSQKASESILLSENQMFFVLQRLVEVGLYYREKNQFHGDFHPGNVSKSLKNLREFAGLPVINRLRPFRRNQSVGLLFVHWSGHWIHQNVTEQNVQNYFIARTSQILFGTEVSDYRTGSGKV